MKASQRSCGQAGVALVMVLWVLVIMTLMAGSFALSMRRESDLVRNVKGEVEAAALADAGIYHAMLMLMLPIQSESRWRGDGSVNQFLMGDAAIRVQIQDEAGRIDLNSATDILLKGALMRGGLEEEEATEMIDVILDWRDEDNVVRPFGAEEDEYKDAGYAYGPRNKPFQTLEELRLVKGVTAALYGKLERLLTVYSKQPGIDLRKASRDVLMAIPGSDEKMVDEYLAARRDAEERKETPPEFPVIPPGATGGGQDNAYRVLSEAMLADGSRAQIQAMLLRGQGKSGLPFSVVSWKRSKSGASSLFQDTTEWPATGERRRDRRAQH